MPFAAPGLVGAVWTEATAMIPTAATAVRVNAVAGIPTHNPLLEIITAAATGWFNVMSTTPIKDFYVGVAGGTAQPTPVPVAFPTAPAAMTAFQSSMGWAGPQSASLAYLLTQGIANATISTAMLTCLPLPGGGLGTGIASPASNTHFANMAGAFTSAINAALKTSSVGVNVFSPLDSKAGTTPQMLRISTSLGVAFATIAASATATIPYTGGASTSPFSATGGGFLK